MNKSDKAAYISKRAFELAQSGNFGRWIEIEFHLRHVEGFPEARQELDRRATRDLLDQICAESKQRAADNAHRT